ncbi:hypothetical protein DPMN_052913 [Dreissena polymorpha]|uniref:Uncharacterized protein n=1 Tax=Dreissena polymorpha TaxID=45954 RepID=A0A9D4CLR4_DREPO|nr:hypothetical protein DPMN_052913 [Dreissena polymorpha]
MELFCSHNQTKWWRKQHTEESKVSIWVSLHRCTCSKLLECLWTWLQINQKLRKSEGHFRFILDDSRTISNLPLSGDGVFGEELENTLKQKKDKRKTLEDFLPEKLQKRRLSRGKPVTRQNRKHLSKDNM